MRGGTRSAFLQSLAAIATTQIATMPVSAKDGAVEFKRLPQIQFIAAAVDPVSAESRTSAGNNAADWGIWRVDPGPRGVQLDRFPALEKAGGKARAGWQLDSSNWWLEEHGLIMEAPDFPLPAGKYMVTGGRETTAVLTVAADGAWELGGGAKLYDVTHLPCRSAKYVGASPASAKQTDFPVTPGAAMPAVPGAAKQDYSVIFVTAIAQ